MTTHHCYDQHFLNKSLLIRKGINNIVGQGYSNTFYPAEKTKFSLKMEEDRDDALINDQFHQSYDLQTSD